ncbi:NAD-dependent epimerase/dehydratase family protein [Leptospira kanakyensis]|uniref:NAD-dependent epimerase/dehydratase family protein n=1 Tax=Leptospira kanakyensis TaxID=2484968 RepID=UPI00223E5E89|nr:SDR family oxidoreductase [Leptospira kanakyensis]MCW7482122.1 SDR family oxidoreductase [Leptospira kanakyensis]
MGKIKTLIVGNMGYIGPVLLKQLSESKNAFDLDGFDLSLFGHCLLGANHLPERLLKKQHFGDVRHFPYHILKDYDSVVYLAAISNDPMGKEFEMITDEINKEAAFNIAKEAKLKGVKSFVFASSCSVYGAGGENAKTESDKLNPLSAYAISKVEAEYKLQELSDKDFLVTCLRFATACGTSPRLRLDLILNDFVATALLKNQIDILSDGTPLRPLIHVRDMSRAIEWAIQRNEQNGGKFLVVNTGSNEWNFTVKELAEIVSRVFGGVSIQINTNAPPDKRSYKVNFDYFKSLAPEYYPIETIENTVRELKVYLESYNFSDSDFYKSDFIRLNVLRKMINLGVMQN